MNTTQPPRDTKIGKKIDYIAKELGSALRARGFSRKNRTFSRLRGDGPHRHIVAVDLQGDKWNMGRAGRFTVNMAVRFPEIAVLTSQLPGLEWQADHAEAAETAMGLVGGFHARLGVVLPEQPEDWWLPEFRTERRDLWVNVSVDADLDRIVSALSRAFVEYALPWLDRRSSLSALYDLAESDAFGPSARDGVFAAILDGRLDTAADTLRSTSSFKLAANARQFAVLCEIAERHGIRVGKLPWTERPTDPRRVQRRQVVETLKADHRERVDSYLASANKLDDRLDEFLDAWIDDCADAQLQADATAMRLWPVAAGATLDCRRKLLLRLLRRFPETRAPIKSTVQNIYATYDNFHHSAWGRLAEALLKIDDGAPLDHSRDVLAALLPVSGLVSLETTSDRFRAPMTPAVKWVWNRCNDAERHALKPEVSQLLDSVRENARKRSRDRYANPPNFAALGEELAAQLAAAFTPEAAKRMDQLLASCPERAFGDDDRDCVLLLRRWLRVEADGRVPLEIERDDWGQVLLESLGSLQRDQREQLEGLFEWFDRGVDVRPSKRWLTELAGRVGQMDRHWFHPWLANSLGRFGETKLKHVAAAPGFGAFPGATSGSILVGLIHVAGVDCEVGPLHALQEVVRGAFVVVPGQRMRCQTAGTAALPILVRTPEGRAFLESMQRSVKQKPVRAAIAKALGK